MIPKFVRQLEDVTVLEHTSATFECETNDAEIPLIWYMDGKKLISGDKFKFFKDGKIHRLDIQDCLKDEEGKVQALIGTVQTSAFLNVLGVFSYVFCPFEFING